MLGGDPENVAAKAAANKPGTLEYCPEKAQVSVCTQSLCFFSKIFIGYSNFSSFIDQFFGGTFEVKMSSEEDPDEPSTVTSENFLQLSCFISMDVKYMQSGLKSVSI